MHAKYRLAVLAAVGLLLLGIGRCRGECKAQVDSFNTDK
jgi:hypothetical protein